MQSVGDVKVLSRQLHTVSLVRTRLALRDVSLYVQKDVQGIPLPETAECLAAEALLRICGLRFHLCEKHNAEYMSPSGRAPFVKCGSDIVSELVPIARYLSGRGVPACSRVEGADGPRLRALCSLLQYSLSAAELRVCWLHDATRRSLTEPRLSDKYPWPLSRFVAFQKRRRALHWLKALDATKGTTFSLEELYDQVDRVCCALSSQLGESEFFFGDNATELEAMVYGHLYMLLTVPVPLGESPLAKMVGRYPNLLALVSRMDQKLFNRSTAFWVIERPEVLLPALRAASAESLGIRHSDASTCTRDDSDDEPLEKRYCAVCMMTLSSGEPSTENLTVSFSDASTSTRDESEGQSEEQPSQSNTGIPRTDSFAMARATAMGVCLQPSRQFYSIDEVGRRETEVDLKLATLLQLTAALLLLFALSTLERIV